jgi:predicted unusual protein kinase regulating ubiquinone biosynthesis (AarF/ABC1/UbiB family)
MTEVSDDIKFGMIEAIAHLIHRDYEAIVEDFVTLDFIPPGVDLQPILPVLAKVFDQVSVVSSSAPTALGPLIACVRCAALHLNGTERCSHPDRPPSSGSVVLPAQLTTMQLLMHMQALEGGGAKSINFQELAADLAQITFDYPFRIPPYFALIIRAIGVLEGIALVGDPGFALVDEAYPYLAKRLLTDDTPRLRAALKYMVYGKSKVTQPPAPLAPSALCVCVCVCLCMRA